MSNILLCGNDKELINKFFRAESDDVSFKFVSTTENSEDVCRHLEAFSPVGFIYCVKNQTEESLSQLENVMGKIEASGAKFVLSGSDEEIDKVFSRLGESKVNGTLSKDMGLHMILEMLESIISGKPISVDNAVNSSAENSYTKPESVVTLQPGANGESDNSNGKKKILVVDDDPTSLRTIKCYLQDEYSVAVATSGQVALKYLDENTVDLVLLDYMMPILDGPTVLTRIRSIYDMRNTPVIFLTGVSDREKITQILASNVQGYLLKPVENEKLHDAIKKAFEMEV